MSAAGEGRGGEAASTGRDGASTGDVRGAASTGRDAGDQASPSDVREAASTEREAGDEASTSAAATSDLEDASDGAAVADRRLAATIARQQARRERAAREPRASLWRHVARVGTLGWIVALPLAAGAVLGRLIDRRLESGVTWTLALILIGAVVAGASLWKMLAEEVER